MEWLNYHHLLYFWTVARRGTVGQAAEQLQLTQATVSAQIKSLERMLGEALFRRSGRKLVLTDTGNVVFRYADEIFSLGQEMMGTLKGRPEGRLARLTVGVANVMPKLVAYALLQPALNLGPTCRIVCREGTNEQLLPALVSNEIDVVLTDRPIVAALNVKAFSHLLGESAMVLLGTAKLAARFQRGFPRSLHGAPLLLPTLNTTARRSLDQWFDAHSIVPQIVAEFEDTALLHVFGRRGVGLFFTPAVAAAEVRKQDDMRIVGRLSKVTERFYAVSLDRKLKHPAVVAISEAAKTQLRE
ncbi:MAG: transcriptional activator NhaR [Deltaproteobacteria bacterium]|nr:transcriptional activator NhaR [Deltaproteobacteria bacterium]